VGERATLCPTLLGFTFGVSLPRAVLVKRPGGVFSLLIESKLRLRTDGHRADHGLRIPRYYGHRSDSMFASRLRKATAHSFDTKKLGVGVRS
jgi:hypothetical protein